MQHRPFVDRHLGVVWPEPRENVGCENNCSWGTFLRLGTALGEGPNIYNGLTPNVVQAIHGQVLRSGLTSTRTDS